MSVEMLLSVLLRIVLALEKIKLERLFFYMLLDCQKGTLCIRVELLTRKRGIDFYNPYLSIDRYQEEKEKGE